MPTISLLNSRFPTISANLVPTTVGLALLKHHVPLVPGGFIWTVAVAGVRFVVTGAPLVLSLTPLPSARLVKMVHIWTLPLNLAKAVPKAPRPVPVPLPLSTATLGTKNRPTRSIAPHARPTASPAQSLTLSVPHVPLGTT